MKNLRKLLPGGKREPKIIAVFSNAQEDCDRLIRYINGWVANTPAAAYPIHVYCLEKPDEADRCAHVVIDPEPRRLYDRAQQELADAWVALSATSWNQHPSGKLMKLIPLTIPPFRGVVGNENGDIFELKLFPIMRHLVYRLRQWYIAANFANWLELRVIWSLRHGQTSAPKILAVFSNAQQDCDRLIRHIIRRTAGTPMAAYPIHVYCLEKPYEAHRCAHVVVDPDPRRLYDRAQKELAYVWVALSATSWNRHPRATLMKLIPLTIAPFRGIVGNENGDVFDLKLFPIARHLTDRARQWCHDSWAGIGHWFELHVIWPLRHGRAFVRRELPNKVFWKTTVAMGRTPWFAKRIGPFTHNVYGRVPKGAPAPIELGSTPGPDAGITRIEYRDVGWEQDRIVKIVEASESRFVLFCPPDYVEALEDFLPLFEDPLTFAVTRQTGFREWRPIMVAV